MGRGTAIPKGRINLPREAKTKTKDRVFVFAEGRQADEAKRAGAEFVGGTDLIDAVRKSKKTLTSFLRLRLIRWQTVAILQPYTCAPLLSSVP